MRLTMKRLEKHLKEREEFIQEELKDSEYKEHDEGRLREIQKLQSYINYVRSMHQ